MEIMHINSNELKFVFEQFNYKLNQNLFYEPIFN